MLCMYAWLRKKNHMKRIRIIFSNIFITIKMKLNYFFTDECMNAKKNHKYEINKTKIIIIIEHNLNENHSKFWNYV